MSDCIEVPVKVPISNGTLASEYGKCHCIAPVTFSLTHARHYVRAPDRHCGYCQMLNNLVDRADCRTAGLACDVIMSRDRRRSDVTTSSLLVLALAVVVASAASHAGEIRPVPVCYSCHQYQTASGSQHFSACTLSSKYHFSSPIVRLKQCNPTNNDLVQRNLAFEIIMLRE